MYEDDRVYHPNVERSYHRMSGPRRGFTEEESAVCRGEMEEEMGWEAGTISVNVVEWQSMGKMLAENGEGVGTGGATDGRDGVSSGCGMWIHAQSWEGGGVKPV